MSFIWATRGREWGFRFLRDGGLSDPLLTYEEVYSGVTFDGDGCWRVGSRTALRLTDPEHRRDRAGRPITHDFVLFGDLAERVATIEDGLRIVWPLVAAEYADAWGMEQGRSATT